VTAQPRAVAANNTGHELGATGIPINGARITSIAAKSGLYSAIGRKSPSASIGQNTGVKKNATCRKLATMGAISRNRVLTIPRQRAYPYAIKSQDEAASGCADEVPIDRNPKENNAYRNDHEIMGEDDKIAADDPVGVD
jgi:hypothetical protein